MLTNDLIKKTRHIEIRTKRLVNDTFAGEYHSIFKGRGMEFEEVRPYQPGDEIRTIDWNVTTRTGEPYVKRFVEERELTIKLAAELTAVLCVAATTNNDRVSLLIFTDQGGGCISRRARAASTCCACCVSCWPLSRGTPAPTSRCLIERGHGTHTGVRFLPNDPSLTQPA